MSSSSRKRSRFVAQERRSYSPAGSLRSGPLAPSFRRRTRTKRTFTPGRDRIGGFYGRYAGRGGELKFHDVDLDDAVVASAGTVAPSINLIAQGVTESTRVGRKCTLTSIHWRYRITLPVRDAQATPQSLDSCRTIMYVDKQCNGAAAAVTDLLESADIHSFRNLSNSQRFMFLLDETTDVNYKTLASDNAGVVSQGAVAFEHQFNKRCNLPIEFNSTTGVIAEIRSNNVGVLLISSGQICGFNSKLRIRFSDGGA